MVQVRRISHSWILRISHFLQKISKKWLFCPILLVLDIQFIRNTNRKGYIAVKMSYKLKFYGKPLLRYENQPFFSQKYQKWLFQPFLLVLGTQFIRNTNRKVPIAVKMSYKTKLYDAPLARFRNQPFSAKISQFD